MYKVMVEPHLYMKTTKQRYDTIDVTVYLRKNNDAVVRMVQVLISLDADVIHDQDPNVVPLSGIVREGLEFRSAYLGYRDSPDDGPRLITGLYFYDEHGRFRHETDIALFRYSAKNKDVRRQMHQDEHWVKLQRTYHQNWPALLIVNGNGSIETKNDELGQWIRFDYNVMSHKSVCKSLDVVKIFSDTSITLESNSQIRLNTSNLFINSYPFHEFVRNIVFAQPTSRGESCARLAAPADARPRFG